MTKHRCSLVTHSCLWFVVAAAFLAISLTEALKHSYYTRREDRSLIGPLGFPFGFLETGHFNLTVFDFQLMPSKKLNKKYKKRLPPHDQSSVTNDDPACDSRTGLCLSDVLKSVKGVGFLLKQFKDEAEFKYYMATVRENPGTCIFQKYLDLDRDDDFNNGDDNFTPNYNDDDDYDYDGDRYDHGCFGGGDDDYGNDDLVDDQNYHACGDDGYDLGSRRQQMKRQRKEEVDEGTQGIGEVIDVFKDGIYLDMLPRAHWSPNSVFAEYDFEKDQAGLYFLIYQVCYNTGEDIIDVQSRFELDFHFSNRDMFGHVSYLSGGEMNLPWLFFVFSLLYAICLYIWHINIQLIKEGKPGYFDIGGTQEIAPPTIPGIAATPASPTIYPIHYLMGLLLALKFCSLLFESIRYHYLRVTGHAIFFSAVYYTFKFLKGITLFTVILLIGSGWSFVKPFLTDREKRMILGVLILQVLNNIAIVVLTQETEGEMSFDRLTAILHIVDIVCCCAVLMPIIWQVNQLEKNMEQNRYKGNEDGNFGSEDDSFLNNNDSRFADADDRISESELDDIQIDDDKSSDMIIPDARMAAKLKKFRSFYMVVISYIYMTRIVVYLFSSLLDYKHTWIPFFFEELTTIFFYISVGYMFRPMNENTYMPIKNRKPDTGGESQVEMRAIERRSKIALD